MSSLTFKMVRAAAVCMMCAVGMMYPAGADAEELPPLRLSPRDALHMAVENSRSVWYSMAALDQARSAYRWRYLRLLPELEVEGALASYQTDASSWQGTAEGSASLLLQAEDLLYPRETLNARRQAEAAFDGTRVDFRAQVYTDYFRLVLQQEETALLERQLRSADDRLEAARFDFDNGRISEYEYLSAQLSREEAVSKLDGTQIEYKNALQRFRLLLGLDSEQPIIFTGNLDAPDTPSEIEEKTAAVLPETPGIREKTADVKTRETALKKVPLRFLPDLSISLSKSYSADLSAGTGSDSSTGSYSVTLSFSFNDLLPGSQYRTTLETARTNLEDARRRLEDNLEEQEVELQELLARLDKSSTDIEAARFKKELADRFYSIAQSEYENGRRDLLELEDADLKRVEAQLSLLSAVHERMVLLIDLERLTGQSLIEW
ncbi:MAG: TolC family protein [Sediminispirochaetaceae bacterium]